MFTWYAEIERKTEETLKNSGASLRLTTRSGKSLHRLYKSTNFEPGFESVTLQVKVFDIERDGQV